MKSKNTKCIGAFGIIKKTVGGLNMNQRVFVFKNGVVEIRDYIVFHNKEVPTFMTPTKTMFGKTVYYREYALRFSTLKSITYEAQQVMAKAGVKLSDLV